jgi:hypothetical protein
VIRVLSTVVLLAAFLPGSAASTASAAPAAEAGRLVALTDQRTENGPAARIRLMDPAVYDWNTAAALKWSWSPTTANGFSGLTGYWGLPSDVKLRMNQAGAYVAVVTDSRASRG